MEGWPKGHFTNCEVRAVEIEVRGDGAKPSAKLLWRLEHIAGKEEQAAAKAMKNMRALYDIMSRPEGLERLASLRPAMRALWSPASRL